LTYIYKADNIIYPVRKKPLPFGWGKIHSKKGISTIGACLPVRQGSTFGQWLVERKSPYLSFLMGFIP
jgi:hypothetical protein